MNRISKYVKDNYEKQCGFKTENIKFEIPSQVEIPNKVETALIIK